MDIVKVKLSRKNNATIREVLAVELPILEELYPGGESDSDIIVLSQRKATKEDMARFLQRPSVPGVEEETEMPDVELCFMNITARYEQAKVYDDTGKASPLLKNVYPSMNAFRRAWSAANGEAGKKAA